MQKTIAVFILLLVTGSLWAQGNDAKVKELVATGHRLRDGHKEALALVKYDEALKLNPNHYEALHNASLMHSLVGSRLPESDVDPKTIYFRKAKDFADRAIKQNPTDAEGYFVMGVALEKIALISSSKERVASSADIKKNAETALRYNPQHAGAWHILGRWNAKVANLNFAEKAAANMLFGGIPQGASNQNAVNCFQNALRYRPNYILYMFDLANSYHTLGNTAKCKETLQALLKLKPVTEDDPTTMEEAKMILAEL
jgi:tetratricopeptide (TPR) repeat protein